MAALLYYSDDNTIEQQQIQNDQCLYSVAKESSRKIYSHMLHNINNKKLQDSAEATLYLGMIVEIPMFRLLYRVKKHLQVYFYQKLLISFLESGCKDLSTNYR